jgi:hypothetical protein
VILPGAISGEEDSGGGAPGPAPPPLPPSCASPAGCSPPLQPPRAKPAAWPGGGFRCPHSVSSGEKRTLLLGRTSSFAANMCPTAKRARDWRGARHRSTTGASPPVVRGGRSAIARSPGKARSAPKGLMRPNNINSTFDQYIAFLCFLLTAACFMAGCRKIDYTVSRGSYAKPNS